MWTDASIPAPGTRVLIRDAEWRITRVDSVKQGGYSLQCAGVSGIVHGKVVEFLTEYEDTITVLKPEETKLVADTSSKFERTRLYLESLFRKTPPTDNSKIYVAYHAAMDPLPYQFNPALQALKQPRSRILIADSVGIGKTLEAGILVSELIARGRGKRILVLATKAMLNQFQQEFWNRFSIPLVRLDSVGIQRIRNRIPANHNPFLYYDRSIISIDTLKQDLEYRSYLEQAHWDIIIIDEAHNVAERGVRSQRSKLAQLLADRSDTMIMLSATPHDGRSESFASLLNILDPTALANTKQYTAADFADKGLVIRRFKNDVRDQIETDFPDREIKLIEVKASAVENKAYDRLMEMTFKTLDARESTGAQLFRTTLQKALFSSPAACLSVIKNRLAKLEKNQEKEGVSEDIVSLNEFKRLVEAIGPSDFSKLVCLSDMLNNKGEHSIDWKRSVKNDRLVIFTESVETMKFLKDHLPKLLKLNNKEWCFIDGGLPDKQITETVEKFNSGDSAIRLMICSDVASEGINLHHMSHRMIHFDMPWSLMTFQQRNGRIDRYGQKQTPQIRYLQTIADNEAASADARILERLEEKDRQAQFNLDDPAEFCKSIQEQENDTARLIEGALEDEIESQTLSKGGFFDLFGDTDDDNSVADADSVKAKISPVLSQSEFQAHKGWLPSLYADDMAYAKSALNYLVAKKALSQKQLSIESDNRIFLEAPADLMARLRYLPQEVLPKGGRFDLTNSTEQIQLEMERARNEDDPWPLKQLLWVHHPVMQWLMDRFQAEFGRHSAPLVRLTKRLAKDETWALFQGGYPNQRGYIPIHQWIAVCEVGGKISVHTLDDMINTLKLRENQPNPAIVGSEAHFKPFIEEAVRIAEDELVKYKNQFESTTKVELEEQLKSLDALREKHVDQVEYEYSEMKQTIEQFQKRREREKQERKQLIDRKFESAKNYILQTATTESKPYLQLVAVFTGYSEENEGMEEGSIK